jgi:Putative rhamnosyl transferase
VKHFVLTRSSFGPAWDLAANRRRFLVTRAVTAPLMARQRVDWTWIVLLDERDPFLKDRLRLYRDSTPAFLPLVCRPPDELDHVRRAAADYHAPWRSLISSDDTVLMTRLDDDDGFAVDALARYQAAAQDLTKRTALVLPVGVWAYKRLSLLVRHDANAMHTLVTPPGDEMCVYDYGHTRVRATVPTIAVDERPGWIWVRHQDTISARGIPERRLIKPRQNVAVPMQRIFPIERRLLGAGWT